MNLLNISHNFFDELHTSNFITYTFTLNNNKKDVKQKTQEALPLLERIIEYEYGAKNFVKIPINNTYKDIIQIGTKYITRLTPIRKIMPFFKPKKLTSTITYDCFKDENEEQACITLITKGEDINLMSQIYDHIRNVPGIEIYEPNLNKIRNMDLLFVNK